MNLECKIAILRWAIKIKRNDDESHLDHLSQKWRDAGREAAYELWAIIRDLDMDRGEIRGERPPCGRGHCVVRSLCTNVDEAATA